MNIIGTHKSTQNTSQILPCDYSRDQHVALGSNRIVVSWQRFNCEMLARVLEGHVCLTTLLCAYYASRRVLISGNKRTNIFQELTSKHTPHDVIALYSHKRKLFKSSHLTLACRVIGKTLSQSPDTSTVSPTDHSAFQDFTKSVCEVIPELAPMELMDVLYLLRRLTVLDSPLAKSFGPVGRVVIPSITKFVQNNQYDFKSLVSMNYALSVCGFSQSFVGRMSQLMRLSPEAVRKEVGAGLVIQLIEGVTHNRVIVPPNELKLISQVLSFLEQKCPLANMSVTTAIHLLILVSKVAQNAEPCMHNLKIQEYLVRLVSHIRSLPDDLQDHEKLTVLGAAELSAPRVVLDLVNQIKTQWFLLLESREDQQAVVMKILTTLGRSLDQVRLNQKEQDTALRLLEGKPSDTVQDPITLRMISRILTQDNAKRLGSILLNNLETPALSTLSPLSNLIDVRLLDIDFDLSPKDLGLLDLLKLQNVLNSHSLSNQLAKINRELPRRIDAKMKSGDIYQEWRMYFRETPKERQQLGRNLLHSHIQAMSPGHFKRCLDLDDFKFVLVHLLEEDTLGTIRSKIQNSQRQVLSRQSLRTMIRYMEGEDNRDTLTDSFWQLVNLMGIEGVRGVSNMMTPRFYLQSVRSMQKGGEFQRWVTECFNNSIEIPEQLVGLICRVARDCASPLSRNRIQSCLIANIYKFNREGRDRIKNISTDGIVSISRDGIKNISGHSDPK